MRLKAGRDMGEGESLKLGWKVARTLVAPVKDAKGAFASFGAVGDDRWRTAPPVRVDLKVDVEVPAMRLSEFCGPLRRITITTA